MAPYQKRKLYLGQTVEDGLGSCTNSLQPFRVLNTPSTKWLQYLHKDYTFVQKNVELMLLLMLYHDINFFYIELLLKKLMLYLNINFELMSQLMLYLNIKSNINSTSTSISFEKQIPWCKYCSCLLPSLRRVILIKEHVIVVERVASNR